MQHAQTGGVIDDWGDWGDESQYQKPDIKSKYRNLKAACFIDCELKKIENYQIGYILILFFAIYGSYFLYSMFYGNGYCRWPFISWSDISLLVLSQLTIIQIPNILISVWTIIGIRQKKYFRIKINIIYHFILLAIWLILGVGFGIGFSPFFIPACCMIFVELILMDGSLYFLNKVQSMENMPLFRKSYFVKFEEDGWGD